MTELSWSTPPADAAEFQERLHLLGLGAFSGELLRLGRPSARLSPDPGTSPESATTRLGGRPLLPSDTPWPTSDEGRPLSFIAQIDCSELAPLLPHESLPPQGLLSFFYDGVEQAAWGFDPLQYDLWATLFTPSLEGCVLCDFPDGLEDVGRYRPMALKGSLEWTPSPWESYDVKAVGMPSWDAYAASLGESAGDSLIHRLLGNPDPVQGDMQHECQLASNGIYCGGSGHTSDERAQSLLQGSSDWRLLLQVDSQEDIGMMWGDVGRLYWWIRDDDMQEGNWEAAWFVLQCC